MIKSFDAMFKQMKDDTKPMLDSMGCPELLGDILDDIETNRRHFKIFYEAGQQSKQAEVDNFKKRIDEAMKYVSESPLKDVSRRAMVNFIDILKGDSHES